MPKVGGKHFPYTKAGVAAAMKAHQAAGGTKGARFKKLQRDAALGRGVHPGMGGQRSPGEHAEWEKARRRREGRPFPGESSPPRRPPKKNFPVRGTPPRVRKKNPYPESDR